MSAEQLTKFKLPNSVASPEDVGKLIREIYVIDNHLSQEAIRKPQKAIVVKASLKLDDLLKLNGLDIADNTKRSELNEWLELLKRQAPCVNISFASEAYDDFIQKLTDWFRKQISPYCLLTIGLDPSIGIGSRVRTTNKVFDFSLKNRLKTNHQQLIEAIAKLEA